MFKVVVMEATCSAGIVKVGNFPVASAQIMSAGAGESTGTLFMFGEDAYYFPNATADLKTTIEKLIDTLTGVTAALTQIGTSLTSIGAGMTGPTTAPPPTLATDVVAINGKVTELNAIKASLNTLKGALK